MNPCMLEELTIRKVLQEANNESSVIEGLNQQG